MCFIVVIASRSYQSAIGVARGGHVGLGPQCGVEKNFHNRLSCVAGTGMHDVLICLVIVNVNVTKCARAGFRVGPGGPRPPTNRGPPTKLKKMQ